MDSVVVDTCNDHWQISRRKRSKGRFPPHFSLHCLQLSLTLALSHISRFMQLSTPNFWTAVTTSTVNKWLTAQSDTWKLCGRRSVALSRLSGLSQSIDGVHGAARWVRWGWDWTAAHAQLCSKVLHVESCMKWNRRQSHYVGYGARGSENFARSHVSHAPRTSWRRPSFDEWLRRRRGSCWYFSFITRSNSALTLQQSFTLVSRVRIQHSPCKALEIGVFALDSCR